MIACSDSASVETMAPSPVNLPTPIPDEIQPPPSLRPEVVVQTELAPPIGPTEKRIKRYLAKHEIKPIAMVTNDDPEYFESGEEEFVLGKNKIVWITNNREIDVKINGDRFSLKNKFSLNKLEKDESREVDRVDFANQLSQAKLYKVHGRELIGIKMDNVPCTGIGCSAAFYLIYDLKTKRKSFFGTYKTPLVEIALYDFRRNGSIDFLSATYSGGSNGVAEEIHNIHHLYTMNNKGFFRLQKPYYFKRTFTADNYVEIDSRFRQNWIEEIR